MVFGVIIGVALIAVAVVVFIAGKPRLEILKVKLTSWTYTIQIEEFKAVKHEGWSKPPANAYNVSSTKKKKSTKTVKGTNGKKVKKDVYDTWYKYTVNEWANSRTVVTHDQDKNPYWGEPNIKTSGNNQLGDERVAGHDELYEASGVKVNSNDTNLVTVKIPKSIWEKLKPDDELNCTYKFGTIEKVELAQ